MLGSNRDYKRGMLNRVEKAAGEEELKKAETVGIVDSPTGMQKAWLQFSQNPSRRWLWGDILLYSSVYWARTCEFDLPASSSV